MKQCGSCGGMIADEANFCTSCGAQLNSINNNFNPVDPGAVSNNATTGAVAASVGATSAGVSAMPSEEPKKKSNAKIIVPLVIMSVVCLAVGIVGIVLALKNNNGRDSGGSVSGGSASYPVTGNDSTSTPGYDSTVGYNDGGAGSDSNGNLVSSGTKVSFAGYELTIPAGYDYEIDDESGEEWLYISNNDDAFLAAIGYSDGATFAAVESNVDSIAAEISTQFGVAVNGENKTVNGVEFVCFNVGEYAGTNMVMAYAAAGVYVFAVDIMTDVNVDGEIYLNDVAAILKTAQKKSGLDKSLMNGLNDAKVPTVRLQQLNI